jgi:glycerol-3-phosphate acyltransferase PlsY
MGVRYTGVGVMVGGGGVTGTDRAAVGAEETPVLKGTLQAAIASKITANTNASNRFRSIFCEVISGHLIPWFAGFSPGEFG